MKYHRFTITRYIRNRPPQISYYSTPCEKEAARIITAHRNVGLVKGIYNE